MRTVKDPMSVELPEAPRQEPGVQVPAYVDIKALRQRQGVTQVEFARRYGFAVGSIRNWEQGCRRPEGPARMLLRVIEREPEAVQRVLAAEPDG